MIHLNTKALINMFHQKKCKIVYLNYINSSNTKPQAPSSRLNSSYRHQTSASIPETIWEGVGEEEEESIKDERRTKRREARSSDKYLDLFHSNP